jgi:excisionase family DNA binding protein
MSPSRVSAPAPDGKRLAYSVPEVAAALGVDRNTVWRYVKSGDLPSRRLGYRVLIPVEALEEWLKGESA